MVIFLNFIAKEVDTAETKEGKLIKNVFIECYRCFRKKRSVCLFYPIKWL